MPVLRQSDPQLAPKHWPGVDTDISLHMTIFDVWRSTVLLLCQDACSTGTIMLWQDWTCSNTSSTYEQQTGGTGQTALLALHKFFAPETALAGQGIRCLIVTISHARSRQ